MIEQLTREQAIEFHDSGAWKKLTLQQRAMFQMEQDKLCMPFDEFHKAVEATLDRPVWTHEFGLRRAHLLAEIRSLVPAPSMPEIMDLLPSDRTLVVGRGK